MEKQKLPTLLFGGDYNPEQWPLDGLDKDIKVFKEAKINSASINIFSWDTIQPEENSYDFSELDKIVEKLSIEKFQIIMATSTAAMPAWLFKNYPEVGRVDYQGRRHRFGQRHNFCPNSPIYKKFAKKLAEKLAERYGNNNHIVAWHINNEYGGNCYCSNCESAFQEWLKKKYQTVDELNRAWNMKFWAHRVNSFDEIVVPNELSDAFGEEGKESAVSGLSLDYKRFQSDSLLNCYLLEKESIEKFDNKTPITTNFHSLPNRDLDYFKWAKYQDIISYDSYPTYNTSPSKPAFLYDLMRSLKKEGFMLMESTPGQVNWQPYSPLKRPGQMEAQELQALAHGASTIQYFQLKQSIGAQEKFHGAVIPHSGRTDTRNFSEIKKLGRDLEKINSIRDSKVHSKVAILFDWDNWWAYEYMAGISQDNDYLKEIMTYYDFFFEHGITVDVVNAESSFEGYSLVVAPVLYMVKGKLSATIHNFVGNGGNFVTTYASGLVDETDNVYLGGYPGPLKDVMGLWVEETDAVVPGQKVSISLDNGKSGFGEYLCDIIRPTTAKVIGEYASEFYAGMPSITENKYKAGHAWYLGTRINNELLDSVFEYICKESGIAVGEKSELDIVQHFQKDEKLIYVVNLKDKELKLPKVLSGNYEDMLSGKSNVQFIPPYGVYILH
ncbi:beta-galactosidase [Ligilactobacillus equi]